MVKKLTKADQAFLDEVLQKAKLMTSAKIAVVVRPASHSYQIYILTYALILGSLVSLLVWATHITRDFPALLALQFAVIFLCDFVHSVSSLLMRFVPRKIKHHHAARAAMREYHARHPHDAPFALLFVSLAERYVHVVTNPVIHARVPDDWHKVTEGFTRSVAHYPLCTACAEAIAHISDILSTAFPP